MFNMNLLQKLFQFFRNLIGPKTTKTPKTITTKLDKIPSSNKLPDKPPTSIQIKQVEQIPEIVTPPAAKIIVQFKTKDGHWAFSNGKKSTPKLEPGYVIDANTLMEYEDYPEIKNMGVILQINYVTNQSTFYLHPKKNLLIRNVQRISLSQIIQNFCMNRFWIFHTQGNREILMAF